MTSSRRGFLGGVVGMASIAGCTGESASGSSSDGTTAETTAGTTVGTSSGTTAGTSNGASESSFSNHPATAGIGSQPVLGAKPGEGEGTVIAFEDPSCPTCAQFETSTFPKLKSELLDTGKASFVYRGIPVVYDWAEPATMALEATYDRSESAFWALKDHYYSTQDAFDASNVLSRTQSFLGENTDVDAAAVVDDTKSGAYQDAVQADLDLANELGIDGTPTFYVFDSGTFSTDITGPIGYHSLKGAMGL